MRSFRKKNPRQVFYNTHTPIFQRENYSSLVRNHSSLFSFPLTLSYIKRRFIPKHNSHLLECRECFGNWEALGICQKKLVRLGGRIVRSGKAREICWQQELGGLKYIGQTKLGGSFVIHVLQLYSLVVQFQLGGSRKGFSSSSSVSSSIKRLGVIL